MLEVPSYLALPLLPLLVSGAASSAPPSSSESASDDNELSESASTEGSRVGRSCVVLAPLLSDRRAGKGGGSGTSSAGALRDRNLRVDELGASSAGWTGSEATEASLAVRECDDFEPELEDAPLALRPGLGFSLEDVRTCAAGVVGSAAPPSTEDPVEASCVLRGSDPGRERALRMRRVLTAGIGVGSCSGVSSFPSPGRDAASGGWVE